MRKLAPFFAAFLLLIVAPLVRAQVIIPATAMNLTEGGVTFTGTSLTPQGTFTFNGADVSLTGGLREGFLQPGCVPCEAGEEVGIRTIFEGDQSFRPGTFTSGGVSRDVYYAGTLVFDGPRIRIPWRYSRMPFNLVFPVTVQGHLLGYRFNPFSSTEDPLFYIPVNLNGTATLKLQLWFINPNTGQLLYRFVGLKYDFPKAEKPKAQ